MPEITFNENSVPFLRHCEVKNGDIVIFENEGRIGNDKWAYGRLQMEIMLPSKERRIATINETSKKNLSREYGMHTANWVGRKAKVEKPIMNIAGVDKEVLLLHPVLHT